MAANPRDAQRGVRVKVDTETWGECNAIMAPCLHRDNKVEVVFVTHGRVYRKHMCPTSKYITPFPAEREDVEMPEWEREVRQNMEHLKPCCNADPEGTEGLRQEPRTLPKWLSFAFEEKPEKFSPLFSDQESEPTVSANAGDERCYVGGGSNNGAWMAYVRKHGEADGNQKIHVLQLYPEAPADHARAKMTYSPVYQELHSEVISLSKDHHRFQEFGILDERVKALNLRTSIGRAGPEGCGDDVTRRPGSAILDVFRESGNFQKAMLYIIGPQGKGCQRALDDEKTSGVKYNRPLLDPEDFCKAVKATGSNAFDVLLEWNARNAEDLITNFRFCLVGGGVFRPLDIPKVKVAEALIQGLVEAALQRRRMNFAKGLKVTFLYDEDSYLTAYKNLISCGWLNSKSDD